MDFSLSEDQRNWQMKARRFAEEEIRPLSLKLDQEPARRGRIRARPNKRADRAHSSAVGS
jgi:hypothetical protein